MAKGKKYTDATKRYDREQLFTPIEAVELVKGLGTASFDESIELAIRLGVDPRKADQIVRGTVALPSGSGKRSEEHTSELQSLMRISYAVFCLKKQKDKNKHADS